MNNIMQIYLVSDSTGETVTNVSRSALAHFDGIKVEEHLWALVRTKGQIDKLSSHIQKNKGIVMDGRDIGTVVFPDAELKIFMTASPETRAQRRFDELQTKGDKVTYEEVLQNVQERDYIDTHREDSPLVMANDAIEIDNSYLTREEQFNAVLVLVKEIINS
jgi:cytidylate kinase